MWTCKHCQWTGREPSISDASEVRLDWEGEMKVDRVHIAVCPRCFHAVRRVPSDVSTIEVSLNV